MLIVTRLRNFAQKYPQKNSDGKPVWVIWKWSLSFPFTSSKKDFYLQKLCNSGLRKKAIRFNMPGLLDFSRDRSLATSEKEGFGGNHHMKRQRGASCSLMPAKWRRLEWECLHSQMPKIIGTEECKLISGDEFSGTVISWIWTKSDWVRIQVEWDSSEQYRGLMVG